jgi:signal transduction histidine kinase
MRAGRQTVMIDAFGIEMQVDISLGFVRLGDSSKAVIATVRDTSELVRANRELEQFAYVASHDLRAPLRAVIGFTDLLKSSFWETPLDEDQNDYLNEIILGAQRMNTLIDSLLAYSRIGRKAPERSTTIITEEVSRIRDELVDELAQAQATVRMDVAPDLTWDVNAALMASAITNILENAIKYRSPARPLQIDIRAGRAQKVSFVSFTDNGSGIAPDALERATEMFQRLTTDGAGIGIGLASVKRIAELHGGAVQIRSDGSSYTEVTLRIPDAPPQRATGGST